MTEAFINFYTDQLSVACGLSDTHITVMSAPSGTGSDTFRLLIDAEIMVATAVSGNVITVTRAQEGSSAASHIQGAIVANILTSGALEQLKADAIAGGGGGGGGPFEQAGEAIEPVDATASFQVCGGVASNTQACAIGLNSTATGLQSFATGYGSATGAYSFSVGSVAAGEFSAAFCDGTANNVGDFSVGFGSVSTGSGEAGCVSFNGGQARGDYAFANVGTAYAAGDFACGQGSLAHGTGSVGATAFGGASVTADGSFGAGPVTITQAGAVKLGNDAGALLSLNNDGAGTVGLTAGANQVFNFGNALTVLTVGATGGSPASVLPDAPVGYWQIKLGGSAFLIPYYNTGTGGGGGGGAGVIIADMNSPPNISINNVSAFPPGAGVGGVLQSWSGTAGTGDYPTVIGGTLHTVSGTADIFGGLQNEVGAEGACYSSQQCRPDNGFAVCIGAVSCEAQGAYTIVHGDGASAYSEGTRAFAAGIFAATGDAQSVEGPTLIGQTPGVSIGETVQLLTNIGGPPPGMASLYYGQYPVSFNLTVSVTANDGTDSAGWFVILTGHSDGLLNVYIDGVYQLGPTQPTIDVSSPSQSTATCVPTNSTSGASSWTIQFVTDGLSDGILNLFFTDGSSASACNVVATILPSPMAGF